MIIKVLPDNTVTVSGDVEATINSTHSHKAPTNFIKAIADALPYKGAMEFDGKSPGMVFDSDNGTISVDGEPVDIDNFSHLSTEAQTFINTVLDNGGRRLIEAKQRLKELTDVAANN